MSLSYVHKYIVVCHLILFLVVNTVADISLDYYFGNEEPLRSAGSVLLEECGPVTFRYRCYHKCGINHACFSDKCFCIKVRISTEDDEEISEEESTEKLLDSGETREELPERIVDENVGAETFYDYEGDDREPPSYQASKEDLNEDLLERPALRHHIAHFCPNLDIARECIKKCMQVGLPAFCGKDHVCYCSHRYETVVDDPKGDPEAARNGFKDLYQKYFGAQS